MPRQGYLSVPHQVLEHELDRLVGWGAIQGYRHSKVRGRWRYTVQLTSTDRRSWEVNAAYAFVTGFMMAEARKAS